LDHELFEQLKPGLSSFKDDPKGGANTLVPLLDHSMAMIPVEQQASTPVNVKATAGLRMLGAAEAERILDATRNLLTTYPFHHDPTNGGVEIMGGLDEAYFAWVTVNYLMNNLGKSAEQTAVMLDLGGGSTQIAMSMPIGKGNIQHADNLISKSVMGSDHSMFLHSYLGYGLMAGRDGIFKTSPTGACPCVPPGSTVSFSYNKNDWNAKGENSNYAACFDVAERYLRQPGGFDSPSQPAPQRGQPIFAMSYYFDVATDVGLIVPGAQDAVLKPEDFVTRAEAVCGKSADAVQSMYPSVEANRVNFLCIDLTFITALLLEGFRIDRTATLNLAKSINFNGARVETQWTLGAAIEEVSKLN
jgi:apyrase